MQDIDKYLPESREYFRKHLQENKEDYFDAMREFNVGPGRGYWYFYRSDEVVQTMRDLYHNLDETFGLLTIPGEFPSEKRLVETWKWFYDLMKSRDELFNDVYKNLDNKNETPSEVLNGINRFRIKIMDVLEHILGMDEVQVILKKENKSEENIQNENIDSSEKNKHYINELTPQKCMENRSDKFEYDIAILTALHNPEFDKVRSLMEDYSRITVDEIGEIDSTIYYKGYFKKKGEQPKTIKVVAANTAEMGMPAATTLAMKMIHNFRPRYLVMLGIAAGIKGKTKIGDILVGEYMWNSGSGKRVKETIVTKSEKNTKTIKKEEHFEPYIHQIQLDTELSALFNDLNLNKRYLSEVKASFNLNKYNKKAQKELAQPISLKIGPFASGSAVIANEDIVKELKSQHGKLIGFDMEAYGVFFAAKHCTGKKPIPISIKSVSDFGDSKKKTSNKDIHQQYAAHTSVEFFYHVALNDLDLTLGK